MNSQKFKLWSFFLGIVFAAFVFIPAHFWIFDKNLKDLQETNEEITAAIGSLGLEKTVLTAKMLQEYRREILQIVKLNDIIARMAGHEMEEGFMDEEIRAMTQVLWDIAKEVRKSPGFEKESKN